MWGIIKNEPGFGVLVKFTTKNFTEHKEPCGFYLFIYSYKGHPSINMAK